MFKIKVFCLNQKISDAWQARIITLFILAFFASITSFLRINLFGYDSYASLICQTTGDCAKLGFQPLMILVLHWLPFSPLVLNFVFWLVCFYTFLALFLIAQHFCKDERRVWLALVSLISFCPFFVFHLHEWENELFAYPLLLFGLYFLLEKKWFPALCLFGLSGLFWAGSAYVLVSWGIWLESGWLLLPFVGSFFVFGESAIGFLKPLSVSESVFGWGLLDLFLLVFVLPFSLSFGVGEYFLVLGLLVGIIFSLLQGKLIVVLVPFVLLGLLKSIELIENKGLCLNMLIPCSFFMLLCMNIAFYYAEPNVNQMDLVADSIRTQKDLNIPLYNDWSYGYWLQYKGFDTNFKGSPPNPDYARLPIPVLILSDQNFKSLGYDCNIIINKGIITKLWKC